MKRQKMIKKTILLSLLFWITVMNAFAQQGTNSGTHFFLAFGKNNTHKNIESNYQSNLGKNVFNVELMLRISAVERSVVTLHFAKDATLDKTITVDANGMVDYPLTLDQVKAVYTGSTNYPSNRNFNSLEITATNPVSLVAMSSSKNSVEATLVLPVEVLGTTYTHQGMMPLDEGYCNGYVVVATEDNTVVTHNTILPLLGTFTTNLSKGQVYYFGHDAASNNNPLNTQIVSNKPIAFFQNGTQSKLFNRYNYSFEQIPPTNQWGKRFILPSTYNVLGGVYAGFARIYSKNNDVVKGTVAYSDGSTSSFTITPTSGVASQKYYDLAINSSQTKICCYITTDKPVGVCAYDVAKEYDGTGLAQPAATWIPPVEQLMHSVLISPLDFDGSHVYMPMQHYFTIITPTASKNSTTIAIDGGAAKLINTLPSSTFTWVADNIGGSGYSFGRYSFGESNVSAKPPKYLKTIAVVDNPAGIIALAYGQGSYTDYYYAVGTGTYDLTVDVQITYQPSTTAPAEKCLNSGNFPTLSVTAIGAGLTYQWYSNTTNSNTGGTAISGATSSTYAPPSTSAGTLYYYCVVSASSNSVKSNVSGAHTVNAGTAVTAQPSTTAPTAKCANSGSFPTLSVTATGTGLSYQWYSNTTNSNTGGTAISGATSATYTPSSASVGSLYYYCVVTGTCGNVTSSVSGIHTVNANTAITTHPSATAPAVMCINSGNFPTLSVTATGTGLSYQWYSNTTHSTTGGTAISGATSATYTPSSASVGSLYYYCVVTGTCGNVTSNVSGEHEVSSCAPTVTTVMGTVFPYVHWNKKDFDQLFPITVNLKSIPNPSSANPLGDLINDTSLYSTKVIYYDGSEFIPDSPKSPGTIGALNNYGLPINWLDALQVSGGKPTTTILKPGEKPTTINGQTLGLFKIENVEQGHYILEIKRDGYVTRWAKIYVDASQSVQYLGHRELLPGDVENNLLINLSDISTMMLKVGGNYSIPTTHYAPKYDLNADGQINQLDVNLVLKFSGFWFYHYKETMDWMNELGI